MRTIPSDKLKREYDELVNSLTKITNKIQNQLLQLATAYPDAIIDVVNDTPIKAKSINNINYIKTIPVSECLSYMKKIEEHATSKDVQLKIEFSS